MATSSLHVEENENRIREGFICPICMEDLVTVDKLLQHFEVAHDTEEDKDVLQSFKGNGGFIESNVISSPVLVDSVLWIVLTYQIYH